MQHQRELHLLALHLLAQYLLAQYLARPRQEAVHPGPGPRAAGHRDQQGAAS